MLNLKNKKMKSLYTAILSLVLFAPAVLFAWVPGDPIIPCDGVDVKCTFDMLVQLAQNIIEFFITASPFVAAVAFAWAGWLYITAGGDKGQISKAHGIFTSVAVGFIIILAAWLIVKAILVGLGAEPWAIKLGN